MKYCLMFCEFLLVLACFSDRTDLNYPPVIGSLNALGPAADFLAPGDRIHQIDGISTIGLTNEHVLNILCHGNGVAILEIEYSLPEYREFKLILKGRCTT